MPEDPTLEALEHEATARHLEENREPMVTRWMNAVAEDDQIPSADRLTMGALRDHFPEMLSELIDAIRRRPANGQNGNGNGRSYNGNGNGNGHRSGSSAGKAHGRARWRNGYRLDEVLREVARIRELVLTEIRSLRGTKISPSSHDAIAYTTRIFFDTIVTESTDQFVKAQEAEVILRSHQLDHAYEQLNAATEQLRSVSQSRLRMLRAVLHELRNSLHSVGMAAVALQQESSTDSRAEILGRLTRGARRLQTVLDRLQTVSKVLAGEVKPSFQQVGLQGILDSLDREHRPTAEKKGLRLEYKNALEIDHVISDPELLRQVASELLSNAVGFTLEGFVLLELVAADPNRWVLSVTDSGPGIDEMHARNIFSEFHPADGFDHPGVRLGLVIARHLSHLIAGEMTFQSTPGKGTRFEVNLPRE